MNNDKSYAQAGISDPTQNISSLSVVEDNEIAYAKIHPGIGIARVGNSQHEFYIGPEYPAAPPPAFGTTRDSTGAMKRQAARFRIYGYNKAGVAIKELTPETADIEWQVEVANTKSSWYVFDAAMDQPKAQSVPRRNPLLTGEQRRALEIRPPAKHIRGVNAASVQLDGGSFKNVPVNLGELRTDEQGRLLVLGGHGVAASPSGAPLLIYDEQGVEHNFNNSVDWYDDISDGPVSATVSVQGNAIPVTGAWVVVAPPDYAPGIVPFRSLYDMARHTAVEAGMTLSDAETSYSAHVLPLLERLSALQWVNLGSAQAHGMGGTDPIDAALLRTLPEADSDRQRFDVYAKFRSPDDTTVHGGAALKWPQLYGDGYAGASPVLKDDLLPVAPQSYQHLADFVLADFAADLNAENYPSVPQFPDPVYAKPIEASPVAEQPARLDAGPLSFCCADAFHPGCELTWPMRHASLYSELVRIKSRDTALIGEDYGDLLTPEQAVAENGPLQAQGPGDLTRWMAVPWQGDTARCRSGYDPEFHPYLPTFWPASVPNEVLSEENYQLYSDTTLSEKERQEAFQTRDKWLRTFLLENRDNESVMQAMVARFDEMGIVQRRPAPADYAEQIQTVFVEQRKPGQPPLPAAASAFSGTLDGRPVLNRANLLEQAGWTEAQWEAFQRQR